MKLLTFLHRFANSLEERVFAVSVFIIDEII
jgi:hypothetical protein